MSLRAISGQVSAITNGGAVNNFLSTKILGGGSDFLRNHEHGYNKLVGQIGEIQNLLSDLSGAVGLKNRMYVIGRIDKTANTSDYNDDFVGRTMSKIAQSSFGTGLVTAVSYFAGGLQQSGVIIDGFDNFRGDISVALPDNPIMYRTSITDHVVRNPNRVTMRVYVDLMHTDDFVQNIIQSVANTFGGLSGTIMKAITGEQMNRAQKALNNLQWIQESGSPFKVYTPHKVYDNMMIEKIAPINDQKMNEILAADITFKEIVPTQPLRATKTTARKPPSQYANALTRALGWTKE